MLAQLATLLYWLVRQYPSNSNLSSFLIPGVEVVILPALFCVTAYFARHLNKPVKTRVFDATFYGVMGVILSGIVGQAMIMVYQRYVTIGSGYWESVFYDLAGAGISYLIFLVFLWRHKG